MHGSPTDNNATLFTEGYDSVLNPLFKSGKYKLAANTAGTWNPTSPSPDALAEFEAAYTAHPTANSAVIPNDENGAPIITYLKSHGIKPIHVPDDGPGCNPDRPSEHHLRVPVRHRLQGRLQGSRRSSRSGDLPARQEGRPARSR